MATPVTALVQPGPAVVTTHPSLPSDQHIRLRRVPCDLLVPHVDDANAFIKAAIIDVDDVAAA